MFFKFTNIFFVFCFPFWAAFPSCWNILKKWEWSPRNGKISKPLCESKFVSPLLLNARMNKYSVFNLPLFSFRSNILLVQFILYTPSALQPPSSWVLLVGFLNLLLSCSSFSCSKRISLGPPTFTLSHFIITYQYVMLHEYCQPLPVVNQSPEKKPVISFVVVSPQCMEQCIKPGLCWVLKVWLLK